MPSHASTLRFVAPALAVLAACGPTKQQSTRLAAYDTISAQKDSLITQLAMQARTLADVTSELTRAQVRNLQISTESPAAAQHDSLVQSIHYIVGKVNDADTRLKASARQIRNLTHISDSLRATLEQTVASLQETITAQRDQLTALTATVDTLHAQNVALTDTVSTMTVRENTVYYVIGTKDQLKEKGLIVEEGGSRVFWVLWKTGTTLQPARNIDATQFTAIDRRQVMEIPLPVATGTYRILSRQDPNFLETKPDANGHITSPSLRITSPEQFWVNSRFLIILQEKPDITPASD